ncbi:MAG: EamA family transporter [Bacteroidetes bacterium]|nr:EamA family transporter [Bacteroidota bacterium]
MWWIFALLSALFAALTAILAKIGIKGIDTNLAVAIRTSVILFLTWGIAFFSGGTKAISTVSKHSLLFLILSGITTGLSWLFYFKALEIGKLSQVAPVDKLSIALTILLSFVILKETVDFKTLVGALLIIGGTIVIII